MDRILKLVYDNWLEGSPVANGLHPAVFLHLQTQQDRSAVMNSNLVAFRDHNNFRLYFKKHHPTSVDILSSEIVDDGSAYLYPVEIRTGLASIHIKHHKTS